MKNPLIAEDQIETSIECLEDTSEVFDFEDHPLMQALAATFHC